jgi:hypothetical protein
MIRISDYYLPKSIKGDRRNIVTPIIEHRIREEFADDNVELGKLLGRDLSEIGY